MTNSATENSAQHQSTEKGGLGHHLPPGFPAPVRGLAALSRGLAAAEGIGIGASLSALIFLALWQLVTRNLRMHGFPSVPAAPDWTDNVLRHAVFLIGFMGAMFATYTARHLRVDAVTRLGSVSRRLRLRALATTGAMLVCGFIIHAAWTYRNSVLDENSAPGQIFTPARGAMIIVLGVCGMQVHFFAQLVIDLTYVFTGRDVPAWWITEASHGGDVAAAGDEKTPLDDKLLDEVA